MTLLLRCPKCGHDQLYQSADGRLASKHKRCVYCNRTFTVTDHIVARR